jgi:hypothetical protein
MHFDHDQPEDSSNDHQKLTVARRVALLERDSRSHARSLTEIVKVVAEQGLDLKKLGEWQMTRLLAEAREEERDKALYTRLDQIDGSIRTMQSVWTRILWIAAGVIVPGAIIGVALVLVYGVKLAAGGP